MRKLKLAVEELRVESFRTEERPQARGTVQGHCDTMAWPQCANDSYDDPTCMYHDTCDYYTICTCVSQPADSCGGTACGYTCYDTCQDTCCESCWGTCERSCDCVSITEYQVVCECYPHH